MAEAEHVRKVVGIKLELTMAEAIAVVNTAERVGSIVDSNDGANPIGAVDWEALCSEFLDGQGREEAEQFFIVSRLLGKLIEWGASNE